VRLVLCGVLNICSKMLMCCGVLGSSRVKMLLLLLLMIMMVRLGCSLGGLMISLFMLCKKVRLLMRV